MTFFSYICELSMIDNTMRIRLVILLLLATAFSAAAQAPVNVVTHYPPVLPPAEIHFTDGNVSSYPIMRISKDAIRVGTWGDQSIRMPLTYVDRIHFKDGCILTFVDGQFRFDKLSTPALLSNESGDVLLEGVLKLTGEQTAALMGPEFYPQFRKNSLVTKIGVATMATGFAMTVPYLGVAVANVCRGSSPVKAYQEMSPALKGVTIGGGVVLLGGIVTAIIGNNNCKRIVTSYNEGLGISYKF